MDDNNVTAPIKDNPDERNAINKMELATIRDVLNATPFKGAEWQAVGQLLTKLDYWIKKGN